MTEPITNTRADQIESRIRENRPLELPVPWHDEIIYPNYDGLSIYNVAQSILAAFGVEAAQPLDDAVWGEGGSPLTDVDRVVLILTDGLGYRLLNNLMAESALNDDIAALSDGRGPVPLTSTAPSTTAVALPTIWTATPPAQHGMIGTNMMLREFGTLANMLAFKPSIGQHKSEVFADWGSDPENFVPVRGLGEYLNEADVPTHLLLAYKLVGTGLSRILHRGVANVKIHAGMNDSWLRLRELLAETKGQRCHVSMYLPNIDTLSHVYGARTPYIEHEVRYQMSQLRAILEDESVQDGRTAVIIMADHGHYNAPERLDVVEQSDGDSIADSMRMPAGGELRFSEITVRDTQKLINLLSRYYIDRLAWVEVEAAVKSGLFGPGEPHPELIYRLGDMIIVPRLGHRLIDSRQNVSPSVSIHGGLSDWEMLVPFLWKRI